MSVISELKEELAKISPWPWTRRGIVKEIDSDFMIRSPERIAALVEYVEAAEEWIQKPGWVANRLGRLQAARKKLGLTE